MEKSKKEKITVEISSELLQVVRTVVHWTPNITLKSFVEDAIREHLDAMPDSDKWKDAVRKLRAGRPLKGQ